MNLRLWTVLGLLCLAGWLIAGEQVRYLPHFTSTAGKWETRLVLSNAGPVATSVSIQAWSVSGTWLASRDLELGPERGFDALVPDIFENLNEERGWLSLTTTSSAVSGVMTFRDITTDGTSSLPLMENPGANLILPMIENTDSRQSGFVATNPGDSLLNLTLTLTSLDGVWKKVATLSLEPHAKLVSMATDLFGAEIPETARLTIDGNAPVAGFALTFVNGTDQIIAVPGSYWDAGLNPSLETRLAQDQEDIGRGGLSLGFHWEGEEPVIAAVGKAYEMPEAAMQNDSLMDIGSLTKSFTATLVLLLQEQGLLNVDDHLSQWFPNFPRSSEVTLRMLLTHTSGIFNYTEDQAFLNQWIVQQATFTPEELIAYSASHPYYFNPGTSWTYSNTNYILLGRIIEMVSGQPYHQQLRERILEPLNLKNTWLGSAESLPPRAGRYLYDPQQKALLNVTDWSLSWAWSTGAIVSTAQDLTHWFDALFGGQILSQESLTLMTTPSRNSEPGLGYGMGMALLNVNGSPAFGHDGATDGGIALAIYFPEKKASFAFLVNHRSDDVDFNPVIINGLQVGGLFLPKKQLEIKGLVELTLNHQ